MINYFKILGERNSGTNYLQNLIIENFNGKINNEHIHKHFFGHDTFQNKEETLIICIVRNPFDWINSCYVKKYNLAIDNKNVNNFLNNEIYSYNQIYENGKVVFKGILEKDLNIYTKCKYKNIFELRHIKLKYMLEDIPKITKNYILIKYEDLLLDFNKELNKISKFLSPKNEKFTNINYDCVYYNHNNHYKKDYNKNNIINIDFKKINDLLYLEFEKKLDYL